MKKILFFTSLCTLVALHSSISAQTKPWDAWSKETIDLANTAKDYTYYNEEEIKVVLFMNLARIDGAKFAETFLDAYVKEHQVENNSYLKSLYKDLKKTKELQVLIPEDDLTSIAQGHAKLSGETGHTGHKNFDKRFDPYMGNPYFGVGENCHYGHHTAIDIVMSLLIDDGIKSLGHRINTLKPEFNSVGVAIRPHKTFHTNCVIDFGKKDRSSLNSIPY